jgi:hypothetical protein
MYKHDTFSTILCTGILPARPIIFHHNWSLNLWHSKRNWKVTNKKHSVGAVVCFQISSQGDINYQVGDELHISRGTL